MKAIFAALSFALLSVALFLSDGHYDPVALLIAIFAALLNFVPLAVRGWPARFEKLAQDALPWLLVILFFISLNALDTRPPGIYLPAKVSLLPLQIALFAAGLIAASYLSPTPLRGARFPLLVLITIALGVWLIHVSPAPAIDVWYFEDRAAWLFVRGQNPWAAEYPNVYGNNVFFGSQLVENGKIQSHTYPPLSVLMTLPGYLLGDVRYSLVLATAGAALFAIAAARKLGLRKGHPAELAIALFLFHPRGLFLLEQSWTEPFVALWAAATFYSLTLATKRWYWLALAGFLSVKQYALLVLPALRTPPRDLLRTLAIVAAGALPFFLWGPRALWNGVVGYQFKLQFRADSLSIPAWILHQGRAPPLYAGFFAALIAAAIVFVLASRNRDQPLTRSMLGSAFVLTAFFLFHKQAFFNYYWLVCALLAFACIGAASERRT